MRKKLEQIELDLPRQLPGLPDYDIYREFRVINTNTRKEVKPSKVSANVYAYQVFDPAGKKKRIYKHQIEALFARPVPVLRRDYESGKKQYNRLSEKEVIQIREMPKKRGLGAKLARAYNVAESTISRIWSEQTRVKRTA